MTAEARAIKNNKGVHNRKDAPIHRVADVDSAVKAKQFLTFLQRAGRTVALVEVCEECGGWEVALVEKCGMYKLVVQWLSWRCVKSVVGGRWPLWRSVRSVGVYKLVVQWLSWRCVKSVVGGTWHSWRSVGVDSWSYRRCVKSVRSVGVGSKWLHYPYKLSSL